MYRQKEIKEVTVEEFGLKWQGKLAADNRWVILAQLVQWQEFEVEYAKNFSESGMGAPAKPLRMALGALIIKEKLGTSDRETVEQIKENPYLQYFIGLEEYSNNEPFEASMLVHFRERLGAEVIDKINRKIVKERAEEETAEKKVTPAEEEKENRGKLIIDATCAPGDIRYPNDLGILNQAREQTEKIIDRLHQTRKIKKKKPITHRKTARKDYLQVAKQRRPTRAHRRKAIGKQLQYIRRNLSTIEKLSAQIETGRGLEALSSKQYRMLLVVSEVYRQQHQMYANNQNRVDDRIVSITQPHIRPIVRGKAGVSVEFGAKLSASCWDGYVFLDRISWDNFNESGDLISQVELFKNETGYYPESVHADKIYRTRANRLWCQERGIRLSGVPLGRPQKNSDKTRQKIAREDEKVRNCIEGKFGQGKRRFSLGRVMTKLSHTSETAIAISFLVMNLERLLRQFFANFYVWLLIQHFSVVND